MNNIKTIFRKLQPLIRRYRVILTGAVVILLASLTWIRVRYTQESDVLQDVPVDTVQAVVEDLTIPVILPPAGDTSVNISKKLESVRNDSIKIVNDLKYDKNLNKSCDEMLAEYKKLVDELISSNYESGAYARYTSFGMIKGENGDLRIGPKLAACKQDSAFSKAFDEIDKRLTNGN